MVGTGPIVRFDAAGHCLLFNNLVGASEHSRWHNEANASGFFTLITSWNLGLMFYLNERVSLRFAPNGCTSFADHQRRAMNNVYLKS
jgi:hypothetical protein